MSKYLSKFALLNFLGRYQTAGPEPASMVIYRRANRERLGGASGEGELIQNLSVRPIYNLHGVQN